MSRLRSQRSPCGSLGLSIFWRLIEELRDVVVPRPGLAQNRNATLFQHSVKKLGRHFGRILDGERLLYSGIAERKGSPYQHLRRSGFAMNADSSFRALGRGYNAVVDLEVVGLRLEP